MISDNPANALCTFQQWDTHFWGFPVARLNTQTLTDSLVDQAVTWCAANEIRCLYFLASGSCPMTLALAAENKFRFVDVRVELTRAVADKWPQDARQSHGRVRPAQAADLSVLRDLAARAHHDTRFFKDGRFNSEKAADLYRKWIDRDFEQHHVMACEFGKDPGRASGYVTCQCDIAAGEGHIGLIAVAQEYAGQGLGSLLIQAALEWFGAKRLPTAKVVTQGTNVAALRLYEGCGFRTTDVRIWFHKWFDEPTNS